MKKFKQLTEELFNEGTESYPADDMTIKELKIACYAAQNILDRLETGAFVQRWQISAIVKAKEELASVYASISAEDDEFDDEDWDEEDEYDSYPGMYESADLKKEIEHIEEKAKKEGKIPSVAAVKHIRNKHGLTHSRALDLYHSIVNPKKNEEAQLDEISIEKMQKVRERGAARVALSIGSTEKDPETGLKRHIPATPDELKTAEKGMKSFMAANRAIRKKAEQERSKKK